MKKRNSSWFALGLVLLLLSTAGIGWSAPKAKVAVSAKPIKVSMFLQDRPESIASNDLSIIKEIVKQTNVSFDFVSGPIDEAQMREKFNVLIASGDIPDVIVGNPAITTDMYRVGETKIFEPLDGLIDKYAPNLKKILKENPGINKAIRLNDGKIYFLPFVGAVKTQYVFLIRQDWLKKLGLKKPETLDDWYTVLKAFRDRDPNGNGKKDEIPFTTRMNSKGLLQFMEAYGITGFQADEQFYLDKGKVKYAFTDPRAKEALTFLNKLYKEHLIDPEYLTNNKQVWMSRVSNELSGATLDWFIYIDNFAAALKNVPSADWDAVAPPKGSTGIRMTTSQQKQVRGVTAISARSKYKVELIKLFDYFYGKEGNMLMNFGLEGKHYTMVGGNPVYTDYVMNNPSGKGALPMLFTDGHREWAYRQDIRYENAFVSEKSKKSRDGYVQYIKPLFPVLIYTPEERNVLTTKYVEIQTYKDEMIDKFIMGTEPLTKWNDFVQKIKAMGIDEVLKIQQTAYNRYNK